MATIFRKTEKGQREIETRALKLAPRFRSALILVDGRRSDAELITMMPQMDAAGFEALVQAGLIEAIGVTSEQRAVTRPAQSVAAKEASPTYATARFATLRREAVRALTDQSGPMSEALALRMERAADLATLQPLLAMAAQLIGNVRGAAAGRAYLERFQSEDLHRDGG